MTPGGAAGKRAAFRLIVARSVQWPREEIREIVRRAFNAVRDGQPLRAVVRVTHCRERSYRGMATWPDRVMLRVPRGLGDRYCMISHGAKMSDWRDCLAFIAGHEFHHIWQYQTKRKGSERGANRAGRLAMACRS